MNADVNDDQRRGLQELADWVASLKARGAQEPTADAFAGPAEERPAPGTSDGAAATVATGEVQPVPGDGSAALLVDEAPDENGAGDGAEDGDDEQPVSTEKRRSPARTFIDWVLVIGIALFVALVIRTFVLAHFVVDGTSMASTLDNGDRVFVNKLSYRIGDPARGDVVVLHQFDGTRDLIKRVIGLEGETVDMRNCQVFIDGRPLEEPYLDPELVQPGQCGRDVADVDIPEDHVFVLGDNRDGSQDSRNIGAVHEEDLVGRAFVVFWPAGNWKWL